MVDRASPSLRAIERRAEAADRAINKLGRSMDKLAARDAIGRIDKLGGSIRGLEQDTSRVDRVMQRAGVSTRGATGEMAKHETQVRKSRNEMGKFEAMMRKLLITTSGLGRILRPAMFLGIAAVIRPLVGVVSALVAGATALVQQVVSASGAIVPLVARMGQLAGTGAVAVTMFLSLKAATLTTKFAFDGVKEAINGNAAALRKLTPEARAFVREMKALQPVMNQLRASAQRGLFPGITNAIRTARRNGAAQQANQAVGGVGAAVGGLAQTAASRFTDPAILRDLGQQFRTFDVVITRVGTGAINLIDALHNILFAAQPLTRWVAALVQQWSAYLDRQTQVARSTGDLGRYFERTRQTLTALGHVVRDFGVGFINLMRVASGQSGNFAGGIERIAAAFRQWTEDFGNQARVALWFQRAQENAHRLGQILVNVFNILVGIGKASQQLGGSLTQSIEVTTRRWSAWVNSFQGQNAINEWMNGMRTTLGQIWGLLADLSGAFARMGAGGGGAVGLLQSIRGLIPDLERALTAFSKNIGPGLFGTVRQLVHLLATLTTAGSGPLGLMLSATAHILQTVNGILDRFRMVRVAVAAAVLAIGGALLIRKLQNIAQAVGQIARSWGGVAAAETVATEGAARYGAVAGGVGRATGVGGMAGFPRAVGPGGAVVGGAGAAAGAGRFGRIGSLLSRPGIGLGLGIAGPALVGFGAQAAANGGLISQNRASQATNVATLAGTGALVGSFFGPGIGTAIGAGVGAGAGLLMNSLSGGGPDATQRYLTSLQRTAGASGFDINQQQGGARNLAQAESYQGVLDRSRERLMAQRRTALAGAPQFGPSRFGQGPRLDPSQNAGVRAITAQLAVNQRLRAANIARLGQERSIARAQREQTDELRKQARARSSRGIAAGLATSFGQAYNVYRGAGMSPAEATRRTVTNVGSRLKTLQPAGARVLAAETSAWLAQQVKLHPELKKEQDRWNTDMRATLKKMHVEVVTAGGKILDVTKPQWQKIASAMQTPVERAREQVGIAFTQLQQQARAVLIGMGYSAAEANGLIRQMEAGGAGPNMTPRKGAVARRAMGGRIPGTGLQDNVPIGQRALAAPGELIVNRHTESRIDKVLRLAAGTTLGREVAGERRPHSMGLGGEDILPDSGLRFARGGRLSAAVREANRIASLRIPYKWGGGHVTPAPANGPFDCSAAVSRVLQAAGYDIPTMTSGNFMNWGEPGPGPIGVAANQGHAYMVLNNRAWGTSSMNPGGGPGWIDAYRYRPGFAVRHAPGAGGGGALGLGLGGGGALMGPLDYSAFGAGLGGVPLAMALRTGHLAAAGIRRKVNRALRRSRSGAVPGGGAGGGTSGQNQALARQMMIASGWGGNQWPSLQALWTQESGFRTLAENPSSGAYGIPQSLPANKMASAGADWRTNPATQIRWGLDYIRGRYGSPNAAMTHERAFNWYGHGGRVPDWGGWHANGLDATFHRPTMIGVGERGSERVTVGPTSGGGLTIQHMEIHVQGHQPGDVKREVEHALMDVARAIDRAPTTGGA